VASEGGKDPQTRGGVLGSQEGGRSEGSLRRLLGDRSRAARRRSNERKSPHLKKATIARGLRWGNLFGGASGIREQ